MAIACHRQAGRPAAAASRSAHGSRVNSSRPRLVCVASTGPSPSCNGDATTSRATHGQPRSHITINSSPLPQGGPPAWAPQQPFPNAGSSSRESVKASSQSPLTTGGGGGDGPGGISSGGGGGRGDGDEEEDPVYNLEQVEALAKERQISLPSDMLQVASQYGLRASALNSFFTLQGMFFTGSLVRMLPALRDRLIADKMFLFKIFVEVLIDSGCTTVAELRKRGDAFWNEFEFYLSDLSVGLVLDVVLVSLMAPVAVIGGASKATMATGVQKLLSNVPSAFFAASVPGVAPYSLGQRLACLAVKFGEYSLAGMACGLVGQGICNALMNWRRETVGVKEDDVAVPPLLMTSLVWGLFMGVSSNLRYQTVFGIERLVDLTIAKKVPQVAYATTVGIRFLNNVIGGENFIDIARWAGCQ